MDTNYDPTIEERARKKRQMLSILLVCIAVPITIFVGERFASQHYMVIATLILIYTMIPFFVVFERRRPKAREIVLIAAMAAITTAAHMSLRVVFPLIQIGTALIVISGVALGPEAGFLIGALARFVCNFYTGHGTWSAWQMVCYGLLGFLAGLTFENVDLNTLKLQNLGRNFLRVIGPLVSMACAVLLAYISFLLYPMGETTFLGWRLYAFGLVGLLVGAFVQRRRLPADMITVALFTFFVTFVVYGGIMNFYALIGMIGFPGAPELSLEGLKMMYLGGAPIDLSHAGTAAACTFVLSGGMFSVLERIKIKYGLSKGSSGSSNA